MPIKVTCACGASFAAKDELAGKTLKCPKCQQPLTIPGAAARPQRQAVPASQATSVPVPQQAAPAEPASTIFDDAGIKAKQHTGHVCPSCFHGLKQGAIICIHCGYNLQLGRKMETQVHGRGDGGHGEMAAVALQRAANMIEEDKQEEKKKLKEGLPWWAYLILFCAAVGLLTMMMLLPPDTATGVALCFLWGGGVMLYTYAHICLLIVAFKDNAVHGIIILLVPGYAFIYTVMHWDQCGVFLLMKIGSVVIQVVAILIWVFLAAAKQQTQIGVPDWEQVAVVRYEEEFFGRIPLRQRAA